MDINFLRKAISTINDIFNEKECGFCAELVSDNLVQVVIEWGDWKHEHSYCDYIMRTHGFIKTDEQVTEEDGSDCYSSIHFYEFIQ